MTCLNEGRVQTKCPADKIRLHLLPSADYAKLSRNQTIPRQTHPSTSSSSQHCYRNNTTYSSPISSTGQRPPEHIAISSTDPGLIHSTYSKPSSAEQTKLSSLNNSYTALMQHHHLTTHHTDLTQIVYNVMHRIINPL